MNTVAAEAVLSMLHDLEDAHDEWARLLGAARTTLRYEDLIPAVERVDQVLGRFVEASQRLRNAVEASREWRSVSALRSSD